ncbi:MAG: hypothetical protein MK116_02805 [Phycisphaerales bacterium]|nr:hypothetical protein [Phycisphaerales bacterium]
MSNGWVAVELGSARLRAVAAVSTRHGIRIVRTHVSDIPEQLDRSEPEAAGRWLGDQLRQAGFRRDRCIVALPREEVVLKRIVHPTDDLDELPDMTQLSMERGLPFESEDAVIDFVVLETTEASTTVLAAALPGEALDRTRRMMNAAGLVMQGVSLRTFGAAAVAESTADPEADIVAIDLIPGDGIEFTFTRGGRVRFSRAARIAEVDEEAMVGAAVREAQRTWLSRQMDDDQAGVDSGVVLGPGGVVDRVAARVGGLLKTPMELLDTHPRIESREHQLDRHWSLAGLLLAQATGRPIVDFASPRKAPDPMAGRRRLALAALAGFFLVVLLIWTIGNLTTRRLEAQVKAMETRYGTLRPEYFGFMRETYRKVHLDLWESADVNWLAHLRQLDVMRPEVTDLVLDEITGTLVFDGVEFDRKGRDWSADWQVGLTINGESRDRAIADSFRERLVEASTYTTSSAGNDAGGGSRLPYGFTYRLRSATADPMTTGDDAEATP